MSADEMLYAAKTAEHSEAMADATSRVERVRARIAQWLGQDALATRGWRTSAVADESYPTFTSAVGSLVSRHSPQGSGASFYKLQSTLMHPSAASATAFATRLPDGRLVFDDFDPAYTFHTVRSAVWSWRVAVGDYLNYHGWQSPELDAWWRHAERVFTATGL